MFFKPIYTKLMMVDRELTGFKDIRNKLVLDESSHMKLSQLQREKVTRCALEGFDRLVACVRKAEC